ncbi:SH3 domain-containing protein [Ruegeria sp. Ofav3-42]|uniref:SH3 domain-containing protein n=1 Tax=Ruegeria sp. Ofav3-42 TaxID=2917759 RepID=UPI001EF52896|nr:SH3 domain-containing protein [Ruegeria sp. Ofav3-42]MCG7518127.1 SH3 domain-containing protein [Ruegeria sp. Ofav3-42]
MKFTLVLLAMICGPALAERQSFPPVDEADRDPTLVAFREALLAKVAARDIEGVIADTCPDIYLSHGGNGGPLELRANLDPDPETLPEQDRRHADKIREGYWSDLEHTLTQPGYFDEEGEFWMPHQWQITLPATLDPHMAFYVTGQDVALRKAAVGGAPILALISHEIVIAPSYSEVNDYQSVYLTDGTAGYMHSDYLWPMTGHRAAFVKSDAGEWQLCTFVSGD